MRGNLMAMYDSERHKWSMQVRVGAQKRRDNSIEEIDAEQLTCSGQWVLWGVKQPATGSNRQTPARLSCPRGSTLTFQHNAGAARVQSRGVTMHPRGRHLREDRILLPHGKNSSQEREQQPPFQLHNQRVSKGPNNGKELWPRTINQNWKKFGVTRTSINTR